MNVTEKLFFASILALSIAGSVQAQSPTQGDYYAPGPTTRVAGSADDTAVVFAVSVGLTLIGIGVGITLPRNSHFTFGRTLSAYGPKQTS